MRKKGVALFISSLYGGGAERVVSRISRELNKEYQLYIFLVDGNDRFYECMGEVVDLGCGSKRYVVNAVRAVLSINKAIAKYDIDCVISFLDVPNIINCLINRRAKRIASIRAYFNIELCGSWKEKVIKYVFLKNALKRADKTVFAAQELSVEMKNDLQLDEERICVIENPYDVMEIEKSASGEIEGNIDKFIRDHKTAVTVGRLDWEKGYEDLIDIFVRVSAEDNEAALIILGDGEAREGLEAMIRERQLEERVLLLGLCDNPFAYMSKCDLYVSCSLHEGFPNTLVEAMTCRLPVIQTDCKTGPREILAVPLNSDIKSAVYSSCGILIPSYTRKRVSKETTQKEFADAWIRLLTSDELREKYSHASGERAEYYSTERCINKYRMVIG